MIAGGQLLERSGNAPAGLVRIARFRVVAHEILSRPKVLASNKATGNPFGVSSSAEGLTKGFGNERVPCFKKRMSKLIRQLETFLMKKPVLGHGVYLAPGAIVVGDVTLGDGCSVWHHAVLRGDINRIVIGHHSNVQDNAVLHLADDYACLVGNYVTIGHSAVVHACTIDDECLIGMGAIILDGAEIGLQSLIGAGALVTGGMKVPPGSLVLGSPARIVRSLAEEERQGLKHWAEKYVENAEFRLEHRL